MFVFFFVQVHRTQNEGLQAGLLPVQQRHPRPELLRGWTHLLLGPGGGNIRFHKLFKYSKNC